MGQRAAALEREIVATREQMSRTIDLMERQFHRAVDWQTQVRQNPLPYVLGAVAIGFVLAGGPRRTVQALGRLRPRPKTRVEKLLEKLPEPVAERLKPPVADRLEDIGDLPEKIRKQIREVQKEREKEAQRKDEERLRRAARATMLERTAIKAAEAAGTALAGILIKQLVSKVEPKDSAKS